jgi:hypothetical protein
MRRKTLYMINPSKREFYDAVSEAPRMGYTKVIAHGHKVKSEFGVKKKVVHLTTERDLAFDLKRGRSL